MLLCNPLLLSVEVNHHLLLYLAVNLFTYLLAVLGLLCCKQAVL